VQVLTALFWCLAAACNLSLIYGLYGDVNGYVHLSNAVASLYAAVHRTAWAIGVAWVIFACVTGNGGQFSQCEDSILYKSVFSFLCQLSRWHSSRLMLSAVLWPRACRSMSPPARHLAANPLHAVVAVKCCRWGNIASKP